MVFTITSFSYASLQKSYPWFRRSRVQLVLTHLAPVGLALLASCSDDQTLREVSGPEISPHLVAGTTTDLLPANIRPEEAVFAALSERIPSSAGYYLDSDGNTVVPVRDSTEFQAAKQAFAAVQPSNHREYARGGVRVIKAQYSFGQLAKTRDALFDNVFNAIAGITSLDLDEVRNRVVIGVDIASAEKTTVIVRAAISKLDIDQNAVEVRSEKAMAWTSAAADLSRTSVSAYMPLPLPNLLVDAWPTLAGGILIETTATDPRTEAAGGPGGCSLGFTAYYTPPSGSSYRAIVTASHCTAIWGAPDNTTFSQGTVFGGTATVDPNKYRCGLNWCRASDAALFQLHANMPYELGLIVRTVSTTAYGAGSIQTDQNSPWFVITQTSLPPTGSLYHKMGRTSGWTTGFKQNSCIDHHLGSGFDQYTTRCADRGTAGNQGGDSGGSVFTRLDSNKVSLIGTTVGLQGDLHVWSTYGRIASDMGGTMTVTRQASLAAPVTSASVVAGHAQVTWPAVSGASEYVVQVEDVDQSCDPYWGCWYTYGVVQSVTITGTTFQDSRSHYLYVIDPAQDPYVHTRIKVTAKNPLSASFSGPSAESRFAHN